MRFSTIALTSAAIIGAAMADGTVYQTQVVTITSCSPDKTDCPANKSHSSTVLAIASSMPPPPAMVTASSSAPLPPVVPGSSSSAPLVPSPSSSAPVIGIPPPATSSGFTNYPNGTAVQTPGKVLPTKSVPGPGMPLYTWLPSASGTGYPSGPANSSAPSVPTKPPAFEGAASAKSFSLAAVVVAAGAAFLV